MEWVHNLGALRTAIQESLASDGLWSKSTNPYIKTLYDNFQACPHCEMSTCETQAHLVAACILH